MKQLFILLSLVLSLSFSAQNLDPVSLEQLVNTDIDGNQYCPVIAADDQGNYMVFWTMNNYSGAIKARRYDSNHNATSDEITINSSNSKLMVAHYWEEGKFVVSYIENSGDNLKFVVINPDNSLEAEVSVQSNIENFDVDINGDTLAFVYNGTNNNSALYLRGYNLNTNAWINAQVLVSENGSANYSEPNVVIHPNGRMTVIYHQYILVSGCCDYYRNIMRKTFSSNFLAEIPEQTLWYVDSEFNVGSDLDAEGNANGEVMIVTTHGTVFSSRHMRLWILDADGNMIVNNDQLLTSGDWYDNVECHLYDNGDFLVTKSIRNGGFSNPNNNEAYVIAGNNYNQSNSGLRQLNSTSSGYQEYVALAVFPDGGFVSAWAGNGFQGDTQGIYSRAYSAFAFPGLNTGSNIYEVNETGTSTSIPIVLNTQPTGNVTVEIASTNTAEVTVSPAVLTFTSDNWDTPQFVTALGVDDASDDGNVNVSITLSTSTSADGTYANLSANSVSVNNLDDDATITAPGNQSVCQNTGLSGVNAIITNNGGSINNVTASSSNTAVIDNADITVSDLGGGQYSITIDNLDNNTLGTTTISIQAQDENFTYTDSFEVEITGVEFTLNSEDMAICAGEEVTLSAAGDATFLWNNGVENNVPFTPNETASYTLTASDDGSCTASATVNITVNETAPAPQISASSMEVCAGEEVTLTADGPANISWDYGISSGLAFIPTETTTYTAVGNIGNECTSSSSIEIVVNPLPDAPQISASAEEICEGTGVTLSASGNVWLSWDNNVGNNQEFFPTSTQTYTVTAGNPDACTTTASITVVVNENAAVPEITASSMEVCTGEEVTLNASGPSNISWNNGVSSGVAFIPTETTTYTAVGSIGNECTSSSSIEIVVNPLPDAPQISASAEEICEGTGVTLSASGNVWLSWDNNVGNNQEFFPTSTQTYTVTAGNPDACTTTASITVVVNENAAVPEISASSMELCAGEALTLTASGPTNIAWMDGVENGVEFIPTASASYTVIGDEGNDCSSSNSIEIIVNPMPNAPQVLASEEEICSGTGITLLALGEEILSWNEGVENNVEFFPNESTTYIATSTNEFGCTASTSIDITVNQTPAVPTITLFNGSLVSSAMSGNQWYLDGEAIDGANSQTLENPSPGNYTVEVSNNGCSNISEAYVVLSTEEAMFASTKMYPNPVEDLLNFTGIEVGTQFKLTDMRGQIVRSNTFSESNESLDVSELASGVYLATFSYENRVQHLRLVKE